VVQSMTGKGVMNAFTPVLKPHDAWIQSVSQSATTQSHSDGARMHPQHTYGLINVRQTARSSLDSDGVVNVLLHRHCTPRAHTRAHTRVSNIQTRPLSSSPVPESSWSTSKKNW